MDKTDQKEAKVIDIKKYSASVHNSPLLSGEQVEVKAYTSSLNTVGNKQTVAPTPQPQVNTSAPQPEVKKQAPEQPKVNPNYSFNPTNSEFKSPESNEFMPPPMDDNIDDMNFGETPQMSTEDEGEKVSPKMAEQNAAMMIGLYSSIVPPMLANFLKNDVSKFKMVLSYNKQIPQHEIDKLEKFLHANNAEIEKALQLNKDQVIVLKQALAAVLQHYKLGPSNPLVNLLVVVIGIAVSQFMTVRAIIAAQNEQLMAFINNFGVTVPEGVDNPIIRKTKIFAKKKKQQEYKEAA
jgi:hypothetical protein